MHLDEQLRSQASWYHANRIVGKTGSELYLIGEHYAPYQSSLFQLNFIFGNLNIDVNKL